MKDSKKIITCGNNNKNGCNDDNSSDSDYCLTNVFISGFHERIQFHTPTGRSIVQQKHNIANINERPVHRSKQGMNRKFFNMDKAYLEGRIWKSSQMLDTKDS